VRHSTVEAEQLLQRDRCVVSHVPMESGY
jgi:hypothetical protein